MKDFRILITNKCNANCKTCFNKDLRNEDEIEYETFVKVCNYLKNEGGISKLKIMGGEPTIHPNFLEIYSYAQQCFESVHLFTNGLCKAIEFINPRENDSIIYNVDCLPLIPKSSRFIIEKPGNRLFETQIYSTCSIESIKKKLYCIKRIIPQDRLGIALTLNCVENIFIHKKEIIEKWNEVSLYIQKDLGIETHVDHGIPFCFFVGSDLDIKNAKSLCSVKCSGLLTPSLNLQYCNQSSEVLTKINVEGSFLPFEVIENRLNEFFKRKISNNLSKICNECTYFEKKCNGGCFIHKEIISLESIKHNSNIPFINKT